MATKDKKPTPQVISDYFSELGKKGIGEAKSRGDSKYYAELVKKRWEAKKYKEIQIS